MKWYADFTKKRKQTSSNYQGSTPVTVVDNSVTTESLPTPESPAQLSSEPSSSTPVVTSSAKKRKKGKDDIDDELRKIDYLLKGSCQQEDEAYFYGMSVAARFRKLTAYQRAIARSGIEAALFKAEFESPEIPETSGYHLTQL